MQIQPQERPPTVKATPALAALRDCGQRLRIMHVLACLGHGGTEFGILKLKEGLGSEYFEHRICTTRQFDSEFVEAHGLNELLFAAAGSGKGLQFPILRLRKIFRQYQPHIVHTRNWGGLEAGLAARLAGVPVVIHSEHGYEVGNLAGVPLRQRVFRRFAYSIADQVVTVTRELRDYHVQQGWTKPERIRVIHNGVDTRRYSPSVQSRELVRSELGIPVQRLVVGSVGRLVPIKDYGTLLRAAECLAERKVDVHVLLVGKGSELESLSRQASESPLLKDRVTFAGASDRVPELLNGMDIFVLPSLGEGMSNTLLEAMAVGLPLIATRVGGNLEVIGQEQADGLFTPGDIPALTERILRLATNAGMRSRLGAAGRKRAMETFSLEGMMHSYCDLYINAAAKCGILPSVAGSAIGVAEQKIA
ncbi:MAG TPA: glycosyltransferase [Candidatus Acidoferrum sp.]|nr:glycosyltransferase [Candidatus Acidoferrum sp.]